MVKFGFKHSEKTREKMSLAHKGKKLSELHKAKLKLAMAQRNQTGKNNPMYGKPSWNKGKKGVMPIAWNKGTKGIMKGFTGKHSQETKEKISIANKGKKPHNYIDGRSKFLSPERYGDD